MHTHLVQLWDTTLRLKHVLFGHGFLINLTGELARFTLVNTPLFQFLITLPEHELGGVVGRLRGEDLLGSQSTRDDRTHVDILCVEMRILW